MPIHALVHLEAQRPRHERRRPCRPQVIQLRPGLPADLQHVRKAPRRDERHPRPAPLQQGIRSDRRAVRDGYVGPDAEVLKTVQHCLCRIVRRGQPLSDGQPSRLATSTTKSVNVPPTSTPTRAAGPWFVDCGSPLLATARRLLAAGRGRAPPAAARCLDHQQIAGRQVTLALAGQPLATTVGDGARRSPPAYPARRPPAPARRAGAVRRAA